jgi:protein-S-isoprenylcysteine O-methyltransferase Ste14
MKQEELSLEEQVERIRKKRAKQFDKTKIRVALNVLFLLLAAIGLAMYFFFDTNNVTALLVIAFGMLFKVVEFILRLL